MGIGDEGGDAARATTFHNACGIVEGTWDNAPDLNLEMRYMATMN